MFNRIPESAVLRFADLGISLVEDAGQADAILARSENLRDGALLPSLIAVGRAGAGVNNIPVDWCSGNGIVVFNTPGANANAVKELVVGALLNVARHISDGIAFVRSTGGPNIAEVVEREKKRFVGFEIQGKSIAIVGLGAIGVMVANTFCDLGAVVYGFDPFLSVQRAWGISSRVRPSFSLNKMLGQCDVVSLHVPLTPETKASFNYARISECKKGCILMNFSRGEIVVDGDIIRALDEGILSCYITDLPSDELVLHPKVVCIPHLGASTKEAEANCASMISEQVVDFLVNGNVKNSVNFPDAVLDESYGAYRLSIINRNVPNMVGQVGSVLADAGVNICEMINKGKGEFAYTLLDVEKRVDDSLLQRLSAVDGIVRVRRIDRKISK